MLKQVAMWAACLIVGPLSAEVIGNVEIQFPPSNYEWKLYKNYEAVEWDDEDQEGDENVLNGVSFYTHREGDALEILIAIEFDYEKGEELSDLAEAQKVIDEIINQHLLNHRLVFSSFVEGEEERFLSFEFLDGTQDIVHGFTRGFVDLQKERGGALSYITTAPKSELNTMVWTEVLKQARFVN